MRTPRRSPQKPLFQDAHHRVIGVPRSTAKTIAIGPLQQLRDAIGADQRDAKSIIELLKENLTLWKEEEEGDN